MNKEILKQQATGFLSHYDKKIMAPQNSINDMVELLIGFAEYLSLESMPRSIELIPNKELSEEEITKIMKDWNKFSGRIIYKQVKPDMHLLFGREVCETMAEEGIDEACNLINDGAEYSIMKTDGSNLTAILSELEDKGGYCFLTLDEYNKILEV